MLLNHFTYKKYIKDIKEKGLLKDIKNRNTKQQSMCLEEFKPKKLPEYIDLNKCIYLNSFGFNREAIDIFGQKRSNNDIQKIEILSKDLNNKKLYTAPTLIVKKINTLLKNNIFGEDRIEKLTIMCKSNYFKNLCNEYWKQFKPFYIYNMKYQIKQDVEVLYFDDIAPDKLHLEC